MKPMNYFGNNSEPSGDWAKFLDSQVDRLIDKYKREYLVAEDLTELLGIGLNNARLLMKSRDFPVIKVGNRKLVLIIAFVAWLFRQFNDF